MGFPAVGAGWATLLARVISALIFLSVIRLGSIALKIIGLIQPAQSSQFVLAGGLRGAGDTRWPLYATAAGVWGVRITLAYLLVLHLGLGFTGAWLAMAVDQFTRSLFIGYRYRSGKWKAVKV